MKTTLRQRLAAMLIVLTSVFGLLASTTSPAFAEDKQKSQDSQTRDQAITEQYQRAAETAVPYPMAEMIKGGWLERTLLKENLLRQNNKNRLAFVTLMSQQGQPIISFPIQGMVFDLNSQMTTPDKINRSGCGSGCGYGLTTASPGDNGTWGPEPHAVSFFTTSGVQIKWNGLYVETDSPLNITTKPVIVYHPDAKPSTPGGGVSGTDQGGIKVAPG